MLLNKLGKPSIYLPACMLVWGTISAATAACKSFGGLLACRFVLGFVEAAYFPGCLYLLLSWYTRKELTKRTAFLYSGSVLSGAFSGLIAAGITKNLGGKMNIAAWQWLFIIEGVITVSSPRDTRCSKEDRESILMLPANICRNLCRFHHPGSASDNALAQPGRA